MAKISTIDALIHIYTLELAQKRRFFDLLSLSNAEKGSQHKKFLLHLPQKMLCSPSLAILLF